MLVCTPISFSSCDICVQAQLLPYLHLHVSCKRSVINSVMSLTSLQSQDCITAPSCWSVNSMRSKTSFAHHPEQTLPCANQTSPHNYMYLCSVCVCITQVQSYSAVQSAGWITPARHVMCAPGHGDLQR